MTPNEYLSGGTVRASAPVRSATHDDMINGAIEAIRVAAADVPNLYRHARALAGPSRREAVMRACVRLAWLRREGRETAAMKAAREVTMAAAVAIDAGEYVRQRIARDAQRAEMRGR